MRVNPRATSGLALAAWILASGASTQPAPTTGAVRILGSPAMRTGCLVADLALAPGEVVSVDCDARVQRWSLGTGDLVSSFQVKGEVSGTKHALSADGSALASVQSKKHLSGPQFVTIWDAVTGKKRKTFDPHPASINGIALSADGRTVATADSDEVVRLWDAATGKVLRKLDGRQPLGGGILGLTKAQEPINEELAARFSPDGALVSTAHYEGENRIHDGSSGKILTTMEGFEHGPAPVVFPDGKTVAYATTQGVKLRSLETGKDLVTLPTQSIFLLERFISLAVSADGKSFAAGSTEGSVYLWDIDGGGLPAVIRRHPDRVEVVAFSPDGKLLAVPDAKKRIALLDRKTGKKIHTTAKASSEILDVAFTPDDARLVSSHWDGTLAVWEVP